LRRCPTGLVGLLVVAALIGAGCGGTERQRRPVRSPTVLGVVDNTQGWGTAMGAEQDLAVRAGAGWLREELFWSQVEPRRGQRRWEGFDRLVVGAAHRGLRVLPLLSDTPAWARPADGGLPTRAAAYGAFVRDAVARYGPSGTFWRAHPRLERRLAPRWFELWNEPYLVPQSHPNADAERYARLAAAGVRGGRRANPAARFLLAADSSNAGRPGAAAPWLDALDAAVPGVVRMADGIAVHPYAVDAAETLRAIDELRGVLRARGVRRPLWITEIGWSTCRQRDGCVSERAQAGELRALLRALLAPAHHGVHTLFVYRLRDLRPDGGHETSFGLLRADGARKPAWSVLRRAATGG